MSEALERGKAIREEMMGAFPAPPSEFRQPFDDLVHAYCFGEVWNRPSLSRKVRSMLTVALFTGPSRPNQLKVHVKAAIANGVTKAESREVIMHAAVYCGIPGGADSFQHATAALQELGLE